MGPAFQRSRHHAQHLQQRYCPAVALQTLNSSMAVSWLRHNATNVAASAGTDKGGCRPLPDGGLMLLLAGLAGQPHSQQSTHKTSFLGLQRTTFVTACTPPHHLETLVGITACMSSCIFDTVLAKHPLLGCVCYRQSAPSFLMLSDAVGVIVKFVCAKNLCQKGGCRQRRGLPVAETARLPPPHHDLGRAVESCCSSKRRLCIRRQDCGHRRGDGEAVRRPRCRVIATHGSEAAHHTRHTGFRQHAPRAKGPSAHAWRLSLFSGPL
jgi:hypothetical protein